MTNIHWLIEWTMKKFASRQIIEFSIIQVSIWNFQRFINLTSLILFKLSWSSLDSLLEGISSWLSTSFATLCIFSKTSFDIFMKLTLGMFWLRDFEIYFRSLKNMILKTQNFRGWVTRWKGQPIVFIPYTSKGWGDRYPKIMVRTNAVMKSRKQVIAKLSVLWITNFFDDFFL